VLKIGAEAHQGYCRNGERWPQGPGRSVRAAPRVSRLKIAKKAEEGEREEEEDRRGAEGKRRRAGSSPARKAAAKEVRAKLQAIFLPARHGARRGNTKHLISASGWYRFHRSAEERFSRTRSHSDGGGGPTAATHPDPIGPPHPGTAGLSASAVSISSSTRH